MKQGIHDNFPMDDYIGDPCPEPSLSTGVVKNINERTPAHAHNEHPRLGNNKDKGGNAADFGSAAHGHLLGGSERILWLPEEFKDYKKNDAKALRDGAREEGRIPMLHKDKTRVEDMVAVAQKALAEFGDGMSEQTLIWEKDGVWHRSRPDWLKDGRKVVVEYKTTGNADPETWIHTTQYRAGYHLQAAMTMDGLDTIEGTASRDYYWLVQEKDPPFPCSVIGMDPEGWELAHKQLHFARTVWRECLDKKQWPGFDKRVHYGAPKTHMVWAFESRLATWETRNTSGLYTVDGGGT